MGNALFLKKQTAIKLPDPTSFAYTGGIQTYVVPEDGIYKLEVWGGQGGNEGGLGGYAVGYKTLKQNTSLYIVIGGAGGSVGRGSYGKGGYNGGGNGTTGGNWGSTTLEGGGGGGGATHIATVTGILSTIGQSNFNNYGLIVAGGGGGTRGGTAGTGGGLTGGNASTRGNAGGGSQTAGGSNAYSTNVKGLFGKGGNGAYSKISGDPSSVCGASGGGGGYFGGAGSIAEASGGGGSGWIGGVSEFTYAGRKYSPSMTNGINSAAGKATITPILVFNVSHRSIIAK